MKIFLDKIRELLNRPLISGLTGLVIGLIIGLPILGWAIWPKQIIDTSPANLRKEVQQEYLIMAIQAYAYTQDPSRAMLHWKELGEGAPNIFLEIQNDSHLKPADVANFSALVQMPYSAIPSTPAVQQGTSASGVVMSTPLILPTSTPAATTAGGFGSNVLLLVGLCLVTLLVGGAVVYFVIMKRKPAGLLKTNRQANDNASQTKVNLAYRDDSQDAPIAQFMTTFQIGDDLYDDSFSIDSQTGEFLGECGMGISETIGVGDPKKVTAFEVWLFDKNDIQTVTKVLMSEHAFNDPNISQRLISKGEPVVVEPGKMIILETASLQLEARVVDASYGKGALPDSSFFERITLELLVWSKMID